MKSYNLLPTFKIILLNQFKFYKLRLAIIAGTYHLESNKFDDVRR